MLPEIIVMLPEIIVMLPEIIVMLPEIIVMLPRKKSQDTQRNKYCKDQNFRL